MATVVTMFGAEEAHPLLELGARRRTATGPHAWRTAARSNAHWPAGTQSLPLLAMGGEHGD